MSVDFLPVVVLINFDDDTLFLINQCNFKTRRVLRFDSVQEMMTAWRVRRLNVIACISRNEIISNESINFERIRYGELPAIPVFLLVNKFTESLRTIALAEGITDIFQFPLNAVKIETRVNFILDNWNDLQKEIEDNERPSYKTPVGKRIFDILFSGFTLLLLAPIFLLIALLIKIESPGPAFYYSFRVGTGYRVFKFFKFRSMYIDADQRLKELKHLNQYDDANLSTESGINDGSVTCNDCLGHNKCQFPMYGDNDTVMCERNYNSTIKFSKGSAFIKIKNDPRITRIGGFLRNSSFDELPQLWNVFIGHMSLVGNRPLPLYEAEKLTTDKYAFRFSAPAGITGLWQVEKRGKEEMSEEERLLLDNSYAMNHSFKNDIIVILKTIPALLQKQNV
jgi:lipopolysaccharide/colanic/teichoic acid biosynthesis glycosyltransferase